MKLRAGATIALVCLSTTGCFRTLASIWCDDGTPRCDQAKVDALGADIDMAWAALTQDDPPPTHQAVEIRGRLHADGKPIRRASVEVAYHGVVQAWTTTDADGRFAVPLFLPRDDCSIDVRVEAPSYPPSSLAEIPCGGIDVSYDFLSGEWTRGWLQANRAPAR